MNGGEALVRMGDAARARDYLNMCKEAWADTNNDYELGSLKLLEGMIEAPVSTFVPPWNRYDENTLRALEALGFSTLSADNKRRAVTKAYKLNFLPYSCSISKLRDAVKASRTSSDPQSVIVVLFHEYDFNEIDQKRGRITYQEFYELLNWLKSQKDVRLLSISQATQVPIPSQEFSL